MDMKAPARATLQRPYRVSLPAGPAAATEARRHIWSIIHAWNVPIDAYSAALLASELVADVVRRSPDEPEAVQLMISWVDDQLRVEVRDRPLAEPADHGAAAEPDTGRGLTLVVGAWRHLRLRYPPGPDRQGR
jgi:hypothetical protein